MNPVDEAKYVQHLRDREAGAVPLSSTRAGQLAAQTLAVRGQKFPNESGVPSKGWFRQLNQRHEAKFRLRTPSRVKSKLAYRDVQRIREFFDKLAVELQAHDYPPEAVLNLDETMVQLEADEKVLAESSDRVRAPETQWSGHVTLLGCVGADGARYPPLYIFKGKRAMPELIEGGGICAVGATGWNWSIHFAIS
jgi:hypothetical protein